MNVALKQLLIHFLLIIMACQILNLSIANVDFLPIQSANSLGDFNNINSAVEYITEIVLGHKDAFPEFEAKGGSQHKSSLSLKHIKLFQPVVVAISPLTYATILSFEYPLDEKYSFLFSKDITPPPPKV